MVRDPLAGDDDPDLEAVLDALDDVDCRTIIRNLEEPRTAPELADVCDIPRSTLYRKLEQLSAASLLAEGTEIRTDGSHASRYEIDFTEVLVVLEEDLDLDVEIERPARRADDRLAELWSEVQKEV